MASYDSERGCYVVRVVYDGPGMAGKTTNLKQVCNLVSVHRRTEVYTPAELKGRTMFFDFMEVDGPPQQGVKIKFQLITVPGQVQRNYRRRPLVEMADVVVFVCDCSPAQVPDTMRTFARLRASMKRRTSHLPVVVQANKQDEEGAMLPEQMRKRLRLKEPTPIMPATAVEGLGVRETLVTAMRLGIETLVRETVVPLDAAFASADTLFDHVLTFEDNPDNEEPVDVEELNVAAEDMDLETAEAAVHLNASTLDALEQRARRAAAARRQSEEGDGDGDARDSAPGA